MRIEGIVVDLVAVFTLDDIWVRPDMVLNGVGSRPLALLSHRSVTVEGLISAGAAGQAGLGRGGDSLVPSGAGGGGGFGGAGGGYNFYLDGGRGGAPYGDILVALQSGSGGGAGADPWGSPHFFGGQGGGALELGALDTIAIRGPGIYADGEDGAPYPPPEICPADFYDAFGGGGGVTLARTRPR